MVKNVSIGVSIELDKFKEVLFNKKIIRNKMRRIQRFKNVVIKKKRLKKIVIKKIVIKKVAKRLHVSNRMIYFIFYFLKYKI